MDKYQGCEGFEACVASTPNYSASASAS